MIVWITKYALSLGIFAQDVEADPQDATRVRVPGFSNFYEPGEWHTTRLAAATKAASLRQVSLARLQAQVDEVNGLTVG